MTSDTPHSLCLIFYHTRQVAARVVKLVLGVHLGPHLGEGEVVGVSYGTI